MNKQLGRAGLAALFGGAALLTLAACDGGSAVAARDHGPAGAPGSSAYASNGYSGSSYSNNSYRDSGNSYSADRGGGSYAADREDPRKEPVRLVKGKPMWAANRRHSAEENAEYQFNKDGHDFGAKSLDDFVSKVHAFVDQPPSGVLTLTRNNGDKLMYDPGGNVFAVVSKDGAPRTMFKPRGGRAYWDQQKQREQDRASGGGSGGDGYRSRDASRGGGESDG